MTCRQKCFWCDRHICFDDEKENNFLAVLLHTTLGIQVPMYVPISKRSSFNKLMQHLMSFPKCTKNGITYKKVRLATCIWQMAWTSRPLLGLTDHLLLTHESNCKVAFFTDYESMFWKFQFHRLSSRKRKNDRKNKLLHSFWKKWSLRKSDVCIIFTQFIHWISETNIFLESV